MRIAVLTPVWKGSRGGGILTYTANVVECLKAMGHSVDVYALDAGANPPDRELRLAEKRGMVFFLKALPLMLARSYDGILCNESRYTFPLAAAYALLRRVHVAYIIHSFPSARDLGLLGARWYALPFTLQSQGPFRVVFVSGQLQRYVARTFRIAGAQDACVIHAGAPAANRLARDPAAVRDFRRGWGIEDSDWLILGLGLTVQWQKAKGAALLLMAVSRMRFAGERLKLMLTRKGHPIYWLRDLARQFELEADVIFTEEIPDPMLALNACDIYAHIVLEEGLPVSLLEAMSLGRPILASRRAGIPEAIDDGVEGLLVEPEVDAIAGAIRRLLDDPALRRRLGESAQRRAKGMSWMASTLQYVTLLGK